MKINNSKKDAIRSGKWDKPNASFYDDLLKEDNYKSLIQEAFLKHGKINKDTPYSSSGCKYPHHVIKDGELVLSEPGVRAAYSRAKQMGVYNGKLKDHLDKHLIELDVFKEEKMIEDNFESIMESINKSLGTDLHEASKALRAEDLDINESIESLMNWTEAFVYDESFRDNVFTEGSINSPYDLLDYMKPFKYGWFTRGGAVHDGSEEIPGDFYHNFHLQSPHQLANSKVGVCWDYVELERQWFTENEYKFAIFYIMLNNGSTQPTHTFLVYNIGNHNYWFEFAWEKYRGIHRYNSVDVMIKDIIMRHRQEYNDYNSTVSIHWLQHTPKYGITCNQYMKYASKEPKLDYDYLPSQLFRESSDYYAFMEDENNDEESNDSLLDVEIDKDDEDTPPEMPDAEETSEENNEESVDDSQEDNQEESQDDRTSDDENNGTEEDANDNVEEKPESLPKQIDKNENDKNGVRRKQLYIAFIEWCKAYNNKNTFGSIFDKDAFKVTYPFVPHEMRYFYRLANPMMCILEGDLTFFPVADLRKINSKNKKMNEMLIFAATPDNNLRVFNCNDKQVYKAHVENNQIVKDKPLGSTFDIYIQNMINKGDILNAEPSEENV